MIQGEEKAREQHKKSEHKVEDKGAEAEAEVEAETEGEENTKQDKPWQYDMINHGYVSALLFSWMTKLIRYSFKNSVVDPEDVYYLPQHSKVKELHATTNKLWNEELKKCRQCAKKTDRSSHKPRAPRLLPLLLHQFRGHIIKALFFKAIYIAAVMINVTFLLVRLINLFDSFEADEEPTVFLGSLEIPYRGFYLAFAFFVCENIRSISVHSFWKQTLLVAVESRATLIAMIYNKLVRIADIDGNTGMVLNLMQNDCERVKDAGLFFLFLFSTPLFVLLVIFLGFQIIGTSIICGFVVVLLSVPIQYTLASKIGQQRHRTIIRTDKRVNGMNEILKASQLIKMYGWETSFTEKIAGTREEELKELRRTAYLKSLNSSWNQSLMGVSTFITFAFHTLVFGEELSAPQAFAVIALFNSCGFPLVVFSSAVRFCSEAYVGLCRMEAFLLFEEFEPSERPERLPLSKDGLVVDIMNAYYSRKSSQWRFSDRDDQQSDESSGTESTEHDENAQADLIIDSLQLKQGTLNCIVGRVGSGKSTLLTGALLGNVRRMLDAKVKGHARVHGSISYVSQQPWVFNHTVKGNILMSTPFEATKFNEIVAVCCLGPDLDMFPAREDTELGERGINISGGQKTRVALARALYADSDLYIFDDILSAVDANVSERLFHDCIINFLVKKGKTVVLATHAVTYLPMADHIVVMHEQRIIAQGSYTQLTSDTALADRERVLQVLSYEATAASASAKKASVDTDDQSNERSPSLSNGVAMQVDENDSAATIQKVDVADLREKGKLIEKESNEVGAVSYDALRLFVASSGGSFVVICLLLVFWISEGARTSADAWVSFWTEQRLSLNDAGYSGVHGGIIFLTVSLFMFRGIAFAISCLRSSTRIHNAAFSAIIKARMSFFYVTRLGVIMNRFSGDMDKIDVIMVDTAEIVLAFFARVVIALVLITSVIPYFAIALVPLVVFYIMILQYCRIVLRQLKRLESMSRTPLVNHLQSTLQGIVTINAYDETGNYVEKNFGHIDLTSRTMFTFWYANRWIGVRLDMITTWIISVTAFMTVIFASNLSGGLAGLVLSSALQTAGVMQYGTRQAAELEANFTSVERLRHFIKTTPQEEQVIVKDTSGDSQPPAVWPTQGAIEFRRFSVAYREGLPLVLKEISFSVEGGKKVALCGRTGSGKSSCLLSLFRIIEASEGGIYIDGINIASVPLEKLRRDTLSIVPQDAVMFRGSVRFNLDPFNHHTDDEIWIALANVHLTSKKQVGEKVHHKLLIGSGGAHELVDLEYEISEGGENLSKGQRQLFCFARALLKNTKIICIDEGTSSVDESSDQMIQQTLKESFPDNTMVIIAHRLNTVRTVDSIFVLDGGTVLESGTPEELISKDGGAFSKMWEAQTKQN